MVGEHRQRWLLVGYLFCFVACAIFLQYLSGKRPNVEGSPLDNFTSALLWMTSLVCLLIAGLRLDERPRALMWLFLCAVFAFLAIDEMYAFHERSEHVIGDDDHVKLLQWVLTGVALAVIGRVEQVAQHVRRTLVTGYVIHGIYILTDLGDGGYFTIPYVSLSHLQWTEELLEISAMSFYFAGFLLLLGSVAGSGRRCHGESDRGPDATVRELR